MIPYKVAVDFVRDLAVEHDAKKTLKQLDEFDEDLFETIKERFAEEVKEGERPLFFYDTSLLQNGKSGMLITNRAIYSSTPGGMFLLKNIKRVEFLQPEDPPTWQMVMTLGKIRGLHAKYMQMRLVLNGETFFRCQKVTGKYWVALIRALAKKDREVSGVKKTQVAESEEE